MKKVIRKIIKSILFPFFPKYKTSFSQSGEDMVLNTILCNINKGFYIDVGANTPEEYNNTCFFYNNGWSGINIDALPGSMKKFNKKRKRDINLELPVSDEDSILKYYMFSSSYYNSFDEETSVLHKDKFIGTKELSSKKLSWIFDNYLNGKEIDFMSVDAEGFDLKVLMSNNWNKYRPKVILFEHHAYEGKPEESDCGKFLIDNGYKYHCSTPSNAFFIEGGFYEIRYRPLIINRLKLKNKQQ